MFWAIDGDVGVCRKGSLRLPSERPECKVCWHLGTWFGECFHHSLTDKSVSVCLNCVNNVLCLTFPFLLVVWNFGTRQAEVPTWPTPNKNLGHWVCNEPPSQTTFSHVPLGAGEMCVFCDCMGIGLLEASLVSSRPHPMCLFPLSPSLIINLSCEHKYICRVLWALANHEPGGGIGVFPHRELSGTLGTSMLGLKIELKPSQATCLQWTGHVIWPQLVRVEESLCLILQTKMNMSPSYCKAHYLKCSEGTRVTLKGRLKKSSQLLQKQDLFC